MPQFNFQSATENKSSLEWSTALLICPKNLCSYVPTHIFFRICACSHRLVFNYTCLCFQFTTEYICEITLYLSNVISQITKLKFIFSIIYQYTDTYSPISFTGSKAAKLYNLSPLTDGYSNGYNASISPQTFHEYTAVVGRSGHSTVRGIFQWDIELIPEQN